MSVFIILFISLFSQEVTPNIQEMPLSEVYLKADEMKSFDFDLTRYSDSVKSEGFDFITLKPTDQKGNGYFRSYYNSKGVQKVVKFSSENKKEYVVFVDARNKGYSFLWLFFYEKKRSMANGFFLNIAKNELYFMGLSEPMGSLLEIVDSKGQKENFDFGQIYTLPKGDVSSVVGQIASVDESLSPSSILHCRAEKPFGVEYVEDSTLYVYSFTEFDCEGDLSVLNEMNFFRVELVLSRDLCFAGQVFNLRDQPNSLQEYYTQRTF